MGHGSWGRFVVVNFSFGPIFDLGAKFSKSKGS